MADDQQVLLNVDQVDPSIQQMQSEKEKTQRLSQHGFGSLFTIIFGILFIYYSKNNGLEGDDCHGLIVTDYWFGIYLIVHAVLSFILIATLLHHKLGPLFQVLTGIQQLVGLIGFALFITITVYFFKQQPCGALGTLTEVYLIMVACALGLVVLACCCFCAACLAGGGGSR